MKKGKKMINTAYIGTTPNSGCLTNEVAQEQAGKFVNALKFADKTVDNFIKTDEGIAKKNKIKKDVGIGVLSAVGVATAATLLVKSGKVDKLISGSKNVINNLMSSIGNLKNLIIKK